MLGKKGRRGGCNGLLQHQRAAGGAQPEGPDIFGSFAFEICGGIDAGEFSQHGLRRGSALAEDVARTDHGVLNVGPGLALEAQSILEVEGDDRVARELEHEVAQRADGDLPGDFLAFRFVASRLARVYFGTGRRDELVDQVVGLDTETLASADLDVGPGQVLVGNVVAQFDGAARSERYHFVAEMDIAVGLFGISHAAQGLDDVSLRVTLPRVNDVVDGLRATKVRMGLVSMLGRDPALVIWVSEERLVAKVLAQQAKLPQVIGDILAHVSYRAVGADNHFGVFVRLAVRNLRAGPARSGGPCHHPAALVLALGLKVEHACLFEVLEGRFPELEAQNLTLAGQEIVFDVEAQHGFEMATQDRGRDQLGCIGRVVIAFLNFMEIIAAEHLPHRAPVHWGLVFFLILLGDLRIEVPTFEINAATIVLDFMNPGLYLRSRPKSLQMN